MQRGPVVLCASISQKSFELDLFQVQPQVEGYPDKILGMAGGLFQQILI